ncbi:TD and POZ domain-containing protein 3-like [Argiope bruennichi]|uniref:TD and POZ domain-containing protein 3-like n=1 Tax=Argiope bruennichi TaxID=94029 RepID=UPI0024953EF5|nr:TD and POZ domain-containing protein 3-like [Argiope bruennichi]
MAVINSKGEKEDSGAQEYFTDNLKKGGKQVLFFNKTLRGSKTLALQDHESDVLLLDCEFVSSNGTVVREHCGSGVILPKSTTLVAEREKSQNTSVLIDALKFMYRDGIRSDTELRTPTQIFPVHKNILSVRSPVFRRMFSNDMKEKNCGYVDITDLEDDTIHRMLLYIYTGTLEDMHFENACKLYAAADKYDIISLRSRCSAFLKESLCPTDACETLILADRHHDSDLKSTVQEHILKHDKEVFGSPEWKHFMDTNPKLAADIMFLKVFPG